MLQYHPNTGKGNKSKSSNVFVGSPTTTSGVFQPRKSNVSIMTRTTPTKAASTTDMIERKIDKVRLLYLCGRS